MKNNKNDNNKNDNTHNTEQFLNYNDVKTKTVNWCTKMRNVNLLTPDQYNKCTSAFANIKSGILPKGLDMDSAGMPINYSLYNTRMESLTPDISGENTNTIMLITNTGDFMACNTNNDLYYVQDINDPNVNQKDLFYILLPQSNDVYTIMSQYGKYLLADTTWGADFSGTTIGPMSSWNISKVNDNITIESVQYKNYFLSFTNKELPLSIIYGKDDSVQWKIIPKTQTNINDKYGEYQGGDHLAREITILSNIKNSLIDKIILNIQITELTALQTNIINNFDKIAAYMNSSLEYSKNLYTLSKANADRGNGSANGGSVTGNGINLTDIEIGSIVIKILNMKVYYVELIKLEIMKIQQKLLIINTQNDYDEYDKFISDIQRDISITKNNIGQNQTILARQKYNYNKYDTDEAYVQTKKKNYDTLDQQLKVNLDIATGMSSQSSLLAKIYPFIILILLLLLIYLIYITFKKFMDNVYKIY